MTTSPETTTPETFQDFLDRGWRDHADDAPGVCARLPRGLGLADRGEQLPAWTALAVHVSGEHLGRWDEGLALLAQAEGHPCCDAGGAAWEGIQRGKATLQRCAGHPDAEATLAAAHGQSPLPLASTRARVLSVAASALAGQGRLGEALETFRQALAAAAYGPGADDPAARALAVTGNNLACELEETPARAPEQDALLELAARTARTYWEVAGGWVQVKFAEYRLAMTLLALGRPAEALTHAQETLRLCDANEAQAGDRFFPHEVLARARHAVGDVAGARAARDEAAAALEHVDEGSRGWCADELAKLDALLG